MIHPTAVISEDSVIEEGACIGPYTIVHSGVHVGAGTTIGSHCVIGEPAPSAAGERLVIGAGSTIRSHSILYAGSDLGPRLETGHHVTIRERTVAGEGLRAGTRADIQGDCTIGRFVRIHSGVFVAKLSILGDFCWLFPHVILTNDPTPPSDDEWHRGVNVAEHAVVGAGTTVLPGVRIGRHAVVGAGSLVTRDVDDGQAAIGSPARTIGSASQIGLRDGRGTSAYPWNLRFRRGYPDSVVEEWLEAGTEHES